MPVHLTILNPAVVFAETVEAVAPFELAEPDPPAFQFHDTKLSLFLFTEASFPKVKPSLSKAVIEVACVLSALSLFE